MDIQTGRLYGEDETEALQRMLGKQIVKLTDEEAKELKSKEVKTMQASKKTMRKIRKRIIKQMSKEAHP